jgi:hypothetical protein
VRAATTEPTVAAGGALGGAAVHGRPEGLRYHAVMAGDPLPTALGRGPGGFGSVRAA